MQDDGQDDGQERQRRAGERARRQTNSVGHTTMASPLARLMAASLRDTTAAQAEEARSLVGRALRASAASGGVLVFSKRSCPRCAQALALLRTLLAAEAEAAGVGGGALEVVELESSSSSSSSSSSGGGDEAPSPPPQALHQAVAVAVQDLLWDLTGARTVPRIFAAGRSLGGYDDLLASVEGNGGGGEGGSGSAGGGGSGGSGGGPELRCWRQQGVEVPAAAVLDRPVPVLVGPAPGAVQVVGAAEMPCKEGNM